MLYSKALVHVIPEKFRAKRLPGKIMTRISHQAILDAGRYRELSLSGMDRAVVAALRAATLSMPSA